MSRAMILPREPAVTRPTSQPREDLGRGLSARARRALMVALGLGLLAGCDEPGAQKPGGAPQAAVTPPTGATVTPPPPPASSEPKIAAYDRCYRECYTAHTNATNRETCKLECDSLAEDDLGARADPKARALVQHLRGCMMGCWEDSKLSDTNRATCLLTCDDDAAIEGTPPPKAELEVVPGTVLTPPAGPR